MKLACVAYEPQSILYEGEVTSRRDLLLKREALLEELGRNISDNLET